MKFLRPLQILENGQGSKRRLWQWVFCCVFTLSVFFGDGTAVQLWSLFKSLKVKNSVNYS